MRKRSVWDEGRPIDMWSVNHFLGGWLIGYGLLYFAVPFWYALVITTILMVLWELFEVVVHIRKVLYINETNANRIIDVILGLAGFLVMYFLLSNFSVNPILHGTVGALFLVLEILGYRHALAKNKTR